MPKLTNQDLQQKVTSKLVECLENGVKPWVKPWIGDPNAGFPTNIASKKEYRGVNPWLLNITSIAEEYDSKWWGTFKQWREKGGTVRKGESATMIVFWKIIEKEEEDEKKKFFFLRYSNVFNLDQVDNLKNDNRLDQYRIDKAKLPDFNHVDYKPAEDVISNTGAKIKHHGTKAYYNVTEDTVHLPPKKRFPKLNNYYGTAFHELTHWAEKRTGFLEENKTRNYAFAELVAEIGACYMCTHLGVPVDDDALFMENSAAYLKSWLQALKDDHKLIFQASTWATKAMDFMLGRELAEAA